MPVIGCCCAVLVGCQGAPLLDDHYAARLQGNAAAPAKPAETLQSAPAKSTIRVFDEVEPENAALTEVVLRNISPGTPVERARLMLEEQGFSCKRYSPLRDAFNHACFVPPGIALPEKVFRRLRADKECPPLYCQATLPELQDWHLASQPVLIVLVPDQAQNVADVVVAIGKKSEHADAGFFKARPDLHAPLGQAVEQARTWMAAAGFDCTGVRPQGDDGDARPHVRCQAFDENWMGGRIVRVHLYPDESGTIHEVKVLRESDFFDAERCMLPHGDTPAGQAALKGILFPVRECGRYAIITVEVAMVMMALAAMPYGK